jgi:predicted HicB family RNase H-like nuclease
MVTRQKLNMILSLMNFEGKFNLRIPPGLHSEIAKRATAEDKSINQWVSDVLEHSVSE